MDTGYISALAALAGSTIGGFTSLAASWLSQNTQTKAQRFQEDLRRRQDLYKNFIEEASKLYADAWQSGEPAVPDLVQIYALITRMRVLSSRRIVEAADQVGRTILAQYRAPNRSLLEMDRIIDDSSMNPLRDFGDACRDELRRMGGRSSVLLE